MSNESWCIIEFYESEKKTNKKHKKVISRQLHITIRRNAFSLVVGLYVSQQSDSSGIQFFFLRWVLNAYASVLSSMTSKYSFERDIKIWYAWCVHACIRCIIQYTYSLGCYLHCTTAPTCLCTFQCTDVATNIFGCIFMWSCSVFDCIRVQLTTAVNDFYFHRNGSFHFRWMQEALHCAFITFFFKKNATLF